MSIYFLTYQLVILFTSHVVSASQVNATFQLTPRKILHDVMNLAFDGAEFSRSLALIKKPTFENTLIPIIEFENEFNAKDAMFSFYAEVSPDKDVRDASAKAIVLMERGKFSQFISKILFNAYDELKKELEIKHDLLDPEYSRYLENVAMTYNRSGSSLPVEAQAEVRRLKGEINQLSSNFSRNLKGQDNFVEFNLDELDGIPSQVLEQCGFLELNTTKMFRFGCQYSEIIPVLQYAKRQATRKKAFLAFVNQVPENEAILKSIAKSRFRLAKVLGYSSCAEFVLKGQMAQSPNNVMSFLDNLKRKICPFAKAEIDQLLAFKNKVLQAEGLPSQDQFYGWDADYYTNLMRSSMYNVDEERVREFFPLDKTLSRILSFCESLFDLKFSKIENSDPNTLWHEDVIQYAMYQNTHSNNPVPELAGTLFFDLQSREGKRDESATFRVVPSFISYEGERSPGSAAILCNFNKAPATEPPLLKHSEVAQLLHELGHAFHLLFSQTKSIRFSGTSVPKDFLECPSQVFEFWAWSKKELKSFSGHYLTNEPIPDDMVENLLRSTEIKRALDAYHQVMYSYFDMALHNIKSEEETEGLDIAQVWNNLSKEAGLVSSGGTKNIGFTSFSHLATGYHATYYGYLYGYLFAVDIFDTLFQNETTYSANGALFKDLILKPGGSRDVSEMLRELLGRDPSPDAFLKELEGASSNRSVTVE